jgi:hypothetical protein
VSLSCRETLKCLALVRADDPSRMAEEFLGPVLKEAREVKDEKQRNQRAVRRGYGKTASEGTSCRGTGCGCGENVSKMIGYSDKEIESVPEGANLGLGCGNPIALASLKEGETVLDLGSGRVP